MLLQPQKDLRLSIGDGQRLGRGFETGGKILRHFGPRADAPCLQLLTGLRGKAARPEVILSVSIFAQLSEEGRSRALGGRGRIVQFMGQVRRKLAQSGQLLGLLLHARDLTHTVQQRADAALAHGGDRLQHLRKERLGDVQHPHGPGRIAIPAVGLHARKGQEPGHLSGAPDKQRHWARVPATHMDLPTQDEVQVTGRFCLAKDKGAGAANPLRAMSRQPGVLLIAQTLQRSNGAERLDDVRQRRRFRRRRRSQEGVGGCGQGRSGSRHNFMMLLRKWRRICSTTQPAKHSRPETSGREWASGLHHRTFLHLDRVQKRHAGA